MSLTGKTALVTGGASGIGRAICERLAEAGASVIVTDINRDQGEAVVAAIARHDGKARFAALDVTDDAAIAAVASSLQTDPARLDILVSAAGWDMIQPFLSNTPDYMAKIVALNLMGPIKVAHALLPLMIQGGGGRIVTVASDAGRVGSMGETVYASAKGGVIAFTKSLARETVRYGINVNCVCPGPTDTPLFAAQPEKMRDALTRAIPMRRVAQPHEIADAVVFFASDGASYITGQVLSVSGGLTMVG
jgi:2-hydroxycyclohexanecarboxyl-CoA dehydrogenase